MLFVDGPISRQLPLFASKDLLGHLQNKSQRAPYGFPDDCHLSNVFGDVPRTCGSCREESDIACAEAVFLAVSVYHKGLARKEVDRFILAVMPFERSWRAIPNHNSRTPVAGRHKLVGTSLRVTRQDPLGGYWIGFELDERCVDPQDRFRNTGNG